DRMSEETVSRRRCVGLLSAPMIAAAVSGLVNAPAGAAEPANAPGDEKLAGARIYNVRDFGAAGDGKTLDTAAVQAAIDACNHDRGGTVLVPAGDFLIGTIELKSNVTLHLAAQGKLLGSPRHDDYARGNGIPPGNGNVVMISAANAENVTIEGRGMIDGDGANFYTGVGDATGPGGRAAQTQPANVDRPHLMVFYRCTNLLLRDA